VTPSGDETCQREVCSARSPVKSFTWIARRTTTSVPSESTAAAEDPLARARAENATTDAPPVSSSSSTGAPSSALTLRALASP
jgi:hypothetical protein